MKQNFLFVASGDGTRTIGEDDKAGFLSITLLHSLGVLKGDAVRTAFVSVVGDVTAFVSVAGDVAVVVVVVKIVPFGLKTAIHSRISQDDSLSSVGALTFSLATISTTSRGAIETFRGGLLSVLLLLVELVKIMRVLS